MRHTVQAEGFGIRLRPVRMEDAAFIVWLRNLNHANGRVGDSAKDAATQEAWLTKYFERQGDYYFIIESARAFPLGAYGIYDVRDASAESGRWVIRPEVPAAIPSALVAFGIAFDTLDLAELRVRTVASNKNVLSLNRKFGFREVRTEPGAQIINGDPVDMVHFLLKATDWPGTREKVLPLARIAEKQIGQWENAQPAQRELPVKS